MSQKLLEERNKYESSLEKNLIRQKLEQMSREEKTFQKFQGYYFLMKAKKNMEEEKKKAKKEKLIEKQEKLREINNQNDKQRSLIKKKIEKMEKNKSEIIKKKEEEFQRKREERKEHSKQIEINKIMMSKEEENFRDDIILDENSYFTKALEIETGNQRLRSSSQNRTIESQKLAEVEMREFKKLMNSLQENSILKKNDKQKRKMYKEKIRKEQEEERKKKEKEMEKLGL